MSGHPSEDSSPTVTPPSPNDDIVPAPVTLSDYTQSVQNTDKLDPSDILTPALALFGEIGSFFSVVKKHHRDESEASAFASALHEEMGDSFWYFTCLAQRLGIDMPSFSRSCVDAERATKSDDVPIDTWSGLDARFSPQEILDAQTVMAELSRTVGGLVALIRPMTLRPAHGDVLDAMRLTFKQLLELARVFKIDVDRAARENLRKTSSRWPTSPKYPPLFDEGMPEDEQLPRRIEVEILEKQVGGKLYVIQKCRGLIIGDRLTDNKLKADDYRFHDVFHLAYAAHLGWSPVIRSLFRVKRKSNAKLDESEDGARAILIEEGISTLVFGRAISRRLFEGVSRLDVDLLKLVSEFASGFEPESCGLWQWDRAILEGFAVFRELVKSRSGVVVADLRNHSLTFSPIPGSATP